MTHQFQCDPLCDIQQDGDDRQISISQVGICDVWYPIVWEGRKGLPIQTTATWSMSVSLPQEVRGTHMSRFVQALACDGRELDVRDVPDLLVDLQRRLQADRVRVEVGYTCFLPRLAPVSRGEALMGYDCTLVAERDGEREDLVVGVRVPVTTLCPFSKAISDRGAHNQRGHVTIKVRRRADDARRPEMIAVEDLIDVAEQSASSPVYPLLKRVDERHVTMEAYDNPVFVEDLLRNVVVCLKADDRIAWLRVRAENQESIHNHNAFAETEWSHPDSVVS